MRPRRPTNAHAKRVTSHRGPLPLPDPSPQIQVVWYRHFRRLLLRLSGHVVRGFLALVKLAFDVEGKVSEDRHGVLEAFRNGNTLDEALVFDGLQAGNVASACVLDDVDDSVGDAGVNAKLSHLLADLGRVLDGPDVAEQPLLARKPCAESLRSVPFSLVDGNVVFSQGRPC